MSIILQLMQDINNQMIYFERKGITHVATIEASMQAAKGISKTLTFI
jgi:hypothetical protein